MDVPADKRIAQQELEIQNFIKAGSNAAVFRAQWKGHGIVAVKMIRARERQTLAVISKEFRVMAGLDYEHICPVYGVCILSETEIWIAMEYIQGGNLKEYIQTHRQLTWELKISFAAQAAKAVNYLHNSPTPYLHRDIKSQNFLVRNEDQLVLAGFGMSKATEDIAMRTNTYGTIRWSAPEVLTVEKGWTEKSDIYSLGMVFYEIASGKIPFQKVTNMQKVTKMIRQGDRPKIPLECPKKFAKIIKKCWDADPLRRPSAEELVAQLTELESEPIKPGKTTLWSRVKHEIRR